ncbi:MAG: hypothetical protein HZB50_03855 [Chloroflexi bacterium]|nr:hypothetical protein [Chloroflexota bacterium]
MLNKFSRKLKKFTTGWLIFVLFLLYGFFMGYIMPSIERSITEKSPNTKLLDLMLFYTPQTAFDMIARYGDVARSIYLNTEFSVDVAFPVVYSFFFSFVITLLVGLSFPNNDNLLKLNLLPFGMLLFDLLENLGIISMLWVFPSTPAILAWLTMLLTMTKWLFAGVIALVIFASIAKFISRKFHKRKRRKSHHNVPHVGSDGVLRF